MIAVITVLRRDLRLWSDFKLFCLLAESVFFFLLFFFQTQGGALAPSCIVGRFCGRTEMANKNKNYAEFQPWVNLSFY